MKEVSAPAIILALGIAIHGSAAQADFSATAQRFRDEGHQLDLTKFLESNNDARSITFKFGSSQLHEFTVETAGVYRLASSALNGYSDDYSITATLKDAQHKVIAEAEGFGVSGGLELEQQLEPGDYQLEVRANRFGRGGDAGDGYYVTVVGLDQQGQPIAGSVDDGEGIRIRSTDEQGNTSVFVRGDDAIETLGSSTAAITRPVESSAVSGVGAAAAAGAVAGGVAVAGAGQAGTGEAADSTAAATDDAEQTAVQTIVTDVPMRSDGEVLTFDVAEPAQVHIQTSTSPTGQEDRYRISLQVVDDSGQVVAEGSGEGYNGNVDMRADLNAGRYRVMASGRTYGAARDVPNHYSLEVRLAE